MAYDPFRDLRGSISDMENAIRDLESKLEDETARADTLEKENEKLQFEIERLTEASVLRHLDDMYVVISDGVVQLKTKYDMSPEEGVLRVSALLAELKRREHEDSGTE